MSVGENFDSFKEKYDEINKSYWDNSLGEIALKRWQEERLQIVLKHVKSKSPFYSRHFKDFDVENINLKSLASLPFTTKDDLRESMLDILSGGLEDSMYYYETTGTTGPSTPCPRDRKESYASNKQLVMSVQAILGKIAPGEKPVAGLMGPTEVHSFGDTVGDVFGQLDLCTAKIWPHSPVIGYAKALQLMKDLKVGIVCASPGMLMTLASEAERRGYNSREDFTLRGCLMSGEICTPALKNNLYSLWGVEAFNALYGSQEALIIAASNAYDQLMPHRMNYIFEVINPQTDESLGESGDGELCVTMLIDGVKPLIRYRTGDLVSIRLADNLDISSKYVMKVVGRIKDSIFLNGREFSAAYIEQSLLEGVEQCLGYQIILAHHDCEDTITANLQMSKNYVGDRELLTLVIVERLRERLGVESKVMLVQKLGKLANQSGWFSWKDTRIVDQRSSGEAVTPIAFEKSYSATVV